jgi:hypothetical protein
MKNILISLVMLVLGTSLQAQQTFQKFNADTTKGAQTKYFTATPSAKYYGIASFEFTVKGFAASDDITVTMQGSNYGFTKVFDIDTVTYSNNTVVSSIIHDVPAKYIQYRLKCVGAVGDTVRVYNPIFIYKKN